MFRVKTPQHKYEGGRGSYQRTQQPKRHNGQIMRADLRKHITPSMQLSTHAFELSENVTLLEALVHSQKMPKGGAEDEAGADEHALRECCPITCCCCHFLHPNCSMHTVQKRGALQLHHPHRSSLVLQAQPETPRNLHPELGH